MTYVNNFLRTGTCLFNNAVPWKRKKKLINFIETLTIKVRRCFKKNSLWKCLHLSSSDIERSAWLFLCSLLLSYILPLPASLSHISVPFDFSSFLCSSLSPPYRSLSLFTILTSFSTKTLLFSIYFKLFV